MKKIFLLTISLFLFLTPVLGSAQGLVPCGNPGQPACTIELFFEMLNRVFNFIVYFIATPLAILMLSIGGIMILISAGNPNLASKGKNILYIATIGLVLVFGAWLIINFILTTLGYQGAWNTI